MPISHKKAARTTNIKDSLGVSTVNFSLASLFDIKAFLISCLNSYLMIYIKKVSAIIFIEICLSKL